MIKEVKMTSIQTTGKNVANTLSIFYWSEVI